MKLEVILASIILGCRKYHHGNPVLIFLRVHSNHGKSVVVNSRTAHEVTTTGGNGPVASLLGGFLR